MQWLLLLVLVVLPRLAFGEPKVALAPLDDDDGKVAEIVGDAVSAHAKLTKPARVEGAMKSMGVSVLSPKTAKKLRAKLDVDIVIYGSVEKDGNTKRVSLTFAGNSKTKPKLEVEGSNPKQLRKELDGKVAKRIASAMEGSGGEEEEEDEEDTKETERKAREEDRKKKEEEEERKREEEKQRKKEEEEERKREEEARRKKRDDDDRRARRDDDRRRRDDDEDDRRKRDDDRGRRDDDEDRGDKKRDKRVADEDEEDGARARKRLGDDEEDEDEDKPRRKRKQKRHVLTQTALWADAGAAFARRTLTYDATGMTQPPPVGTVAPAGQLEAELYPAAFSSLKSTVAGFGIAGAYSRTFALGIAVPGTQITAPIKCGAYTVGARYRFVFGQHSFAVGASYWRRYYMADRSKLMNKDQLDMPDVDYKAVAPGAVVRIAATPKIGAFGTLDVPLVLSSGPIQLPASYGSAKIIAFDFRGGAQIMVADHAALELTAAFTQIGFAFTKQAGSKASTREVSSATDRSIGLSATIGITY